MSSKKIIEFRIMRKFKKCVSSKTKYKKYILLYYYIRYIIKYTLISIHKSFTNQFVINLSLKSDKIIFYT